MNDQDELTALIQPTRLWSRAEIVAEPCPFLVRPACMRGSSARFRRTFRLPVVFNETGLTLLYVGISPKKPTPGKKPSKETIQSRLCDHMGKTNAEGSTIRMTLGCLLSETLGIRLKRPGNRFTFGSALSEWIDATPSCRGRCILSRGCWKIA